MREPTTIFPEKGNRWMLLSALVFSVNIPVASVIS
jgi:hypothetical protein